MHTAEARLEAFFVGVDHFCKEAGLDERHTVILQNKMVMHLFERIGGSIEKSASDLFTGMTKSASAVPPRLGPMIKRAADPIADSMKQYEAQVAQRKSQMAEQRTAPFSPLAAPKAAPVQTPPRETAQQPTQQDLSANFSNILKGVIPPLSSESTQVHLPPELNEFVDKLQGIPQRLAGSVSRITEGVVPPLTSDIAVGRSPIVAAAQKSTPQSLAQAQAGPTQEDLKGHFSNILKDILSPETSNQDLRDRRKYTAGLMESPVDKIVRQGRSPGQMLTTPPAVEDDHANSPTNVSIGGDNTTVNDAAVAAAKKVAPNASPGVWAQIVEYFKKNPGMIATILGSMALGGIGGGIAGGGRGALAGMALAGLGGGLMGHYDVGGVRSGYGKQIEDETRKLLASYKSPGTPAPLPGQAPVAPARS